jgi:hypothetical protein
VPEKLAE